MRQRKLITAKRSSNSNHASSDRHGNSEAKQLSFYNSALTSNCFIADLDPSCCVPLWLLRDLQKNAVAKIKCVLLGTSKSSSQHLHGYVCGTPTFTVIELKDELRDLLVQFWESNKDTDQDVEEIIQSNPKWYGIVDGCQFHTAIMELKEADPSEWTNFSWKVVVLQHTPFVSHLRKLARVLNERNKPIYSFDVTIYDLLNGLRMEYDILLKEKKTESRSGNVNVSTREVAEAYDGGDHRNNTSIRQAAGLAIKLHPLTIKAIGETVNHSCADVIIRSKELNRLELKTEEELLEHEDCRLFKSFVCFGSLRSATNFLKAVTSGDSNSQTNTIYRIRHYCELHNYKPVQSKVVCDQFEYAKQALIEEGKFLNEIGEKQWPKHMETIQENLLRTTLCDEELSRNTGNDSDVLSSIWRCFKSLYPAKAKNIEEGISGEAADGVGGGGSGSTDSEEQTNGPSEPDTEEPDSSNEENQESLTPEQQEDRRVRALQEDADSKVSAAGIVTHEMPLSHFTSMHWTTNSRKADLIFSCITDVNEDDFIKKLPSFSKLVLNPGSYIFLILTVHQFVELSNEFKAEGFKVSDHPFDIIYDVSTVQRRHTADFPQRHSDIALVCRSSGDHPTKFHPFNPTQSESESLLSDEASNQASIDAANEEICQAHFASLLNVSTCRKKLKRPRCNSALFPWERNYDLISRIVQTFCPFEGLVIDPFPGPLSTALACLKSRRHCISIAPEGNDINYAKGRLRIHATDNSTMEDLEDFSRSVKSDDLDSTQPISNNEDQPPETEGTDRLNEVSELKRRRSNVPTTNKNMEETAAQTLLQLNL